MKSFIRLIAGLVLGGAILVGCSAQPPAPTAAPTVAVPPTSIPSTGYPDPQGYPAPTVEQTATP